MAFKVNYGFQKAERDRAKKAKKEAKARERDAARAGKTEPGPDAAEHEGQPAETAPGEAET